MLTADVFSVNTSDEQGIEMCAVEERSSVLQFVWFQRSNTKVMRFQRKAEMLSLYRCFELDQHFKADLTVWSQPSCD